MKMESISELSIKEPLAQTDLVIDTIYSGTRFGNARDDVLSQLLGVDNSGGFRYLGKPRTDIQKLKILVLLTGFDEPEWPDSLDIENGVFTYFGDKRTPGKLHETGRDGNLVLRNIFEESHTIPEATSNFPAIFVFSKTKTYRDVKFLGLAVPGVKGMSSDEDLIAIWRKSSKGERFQNYRAHFTLLDIPVITRAWIDDIKNGKAFSSSNAPSAWKDWVKYRRYKPLKIEKTNKARTKKQQLDLSKKEFEIISKIHNEYKEKPFKFEKFAAKIVELALPSSHSIQLTKPWRDGGRDALGKYRIGIGEGSIDVEFAIEAKCYHIENGVGIKDTSRLISRLRHRQFGIIVTTSYLSKQAYDEIIIDQHPIIVISANEISKLIVNKITSETEFLKWLTEAI